MAFWVVQALRVIDDQKILANLPFCALVLDCFYPSCLCPVSWFAWSFSNLLLGCLFTSTITFVVVAETILRNGMKELSASQSKFRHLLNNYIATKTVSSACIYLMSGLIVPDKVLRSAFLSSLPVLLTESLSAIDIIFYKWKL